MPSLTNKIGKYGYPIVNCLNCSEELDINDPAGIDVKVGKNLERCCNKHCWEAYSFRHLFDDREEQIHKLREEVAELKALNRAKHETIEALKTKNDKLKMSVEFWYGQLGEAIEFNEREIRN